MKNLLCFFAAAAMALAQPAPASRTFAIQHVTIIDVENGRLQPDSTVVVEGGRIVASGARVATPAGAEVINAAGKFLIPGLWDMHVHSATDKDTFIPSFVVNGITGVRSMFDDFDEIQKRRKEIAAGELTGPRIYASGPIVDGPKPIWQGSIAVSNAEEGRQAVDDLKKRGVDFIKVYSLLPRDAYFAIASEAKKQNIPYAGHVPLSVSAAEASDAGQKSIEHLTQIVVSSARDEADLIKREQTGTFDVKTYFGFPAIAAKTYDPERAKALFAKFAKNGTWQTPTMVVLRLFGNSSDPAITQDPRFKYMPSWVRSFWTASPLDKGLTADDIAAQKNLFDLELRMVGQMQKSGVRILAGTDTPNPYIMPGFSLHDELQLLVKAGLTPLEALQSATLRPAQYLGITNVAGSIAAGKNADLVLLNANPLSDISNTQKIEAVFLGGKYLDRKQLDAILTKLESASQPSANKGAAPRVPANGIVSDFDDGKTTTSFGSGWAISTDAFAGGKSKASMTVASDGAHQSSGSLLIQGEVKTGFQFPWAGAMFFPGPAAMKPADLSAFKTLSFWAKGEGRAYEVMMFAQSRGPMPSTKTFVAGAEWKQYSFAISDFDKMPGSDLIGVFFGAGAPLGAFQLWIDDIRFE